MNPNLNINAPVASALRENILEACRNIIKCEIQILIDILNKNYDFFDKLSKKVESNIILGVKSLEDHNQRLEELEQIKGLVCRALDKTLCSIHQRLDNLETFSSSHESYLKHSPNAIKIEPIISDSDSVGGCVL